MQEKQETSTLNNTILSILIPITPDRKEIVQKLLSKFGITMGMNAFVDDWWEILHWQNEDETTEVVMMQDRKEMTIGEKREIMYQKAKGLYSWQIDSDDDIADDAIELILEAIKQEPDCITFEEYVNIDGKEYKSNHSLSYPGWVGNGEYLLSDGFHFWRTPFFKSVIKTEIARSVPILHIRFGEDNEWADKLQPHLKTEVHIPKQLYLYKHISSPFNERYGIK